MHQQLWGADSQGTSLFSRNKQRSRKFKHFTTASEIKSYREHPQKHKPQEMITQYACNKPASWPLNGRLSAAKMRFTQSKVRMLHALCSASNLRAREKRRKTSVQADSQGHVSLVSRAYDVLFGLSTLISNRILFHNLCEIEYSAGCWNTISAGVTQTSLFRVQQRK